MEKIPSFDKLSQDESRKLKEVLEKAKEEAPYDFTVEENTDTVMIRRKDEAGREIGMGFTKVGDTIKLADGSEHHFSEIVEARLKYPNENVLHALQKLKQEKEKKTS